METENSTHKICCHGGVQDDIRGPPAIPDKLAGAGVHHRNRSLGFTIHGNHAEYQQHCDEMNFRLPSVSVYDMIHT